MRRDVTIRDVPPNVVRLATVILATAGTASVVKGVDLSTDGDEHRLLTYLGFYGAGVTLLFVALVVWWIYVRPHETPSTQQTAHADHGERR